MQVFKLVTKGTLEERIHRMIERKRTMAEALITSDLDQVKTFTRAELLELLSVTPASQAALRHPQRRRTLQSGPGRAVLRAAMPAPA